mmetsp:Transcript_7668/g.18796  ORF Transcript_7668/g.18796 Transcript_7668/m.18796 type:complete len:252 (-) Transcript_7668:714-1469(-)
MDLNGVLLAVMGFHRWIDVSVLGSVWPVMRYRDPDSDTHCSTSVGGMVASCAMSLKTTSAGPNALVDTSHTAAKPELLAVCMPAMARYLPVGSNCSLSILTFNLRVSGNFPSLSWCLLLPSMSNTSTLLVWSCCTKLIANLSVVPLHCHAVAMHRPCVVMPTSTGSRVLIVSSSPSLVSGSCMIDTYRAKCGLAPSNSATISPEAEGFHLISNRPSAEPECSSALPGSGCGSTALAFLPLADFLSRSYMVI